MRILKNRDFDRWARDVDLEDASLLGAINEMVSGLYDANLGGNVYKKRVSIANRGKSSGARTIVAFKIYGNAFFVYGFSKNRKVNISKKEEEALKILAKVYLGYEEREISALVKSGALIEVTV